MTAKVQSAGITVRMVTGDNLDTAVRIARQCQILPTQTSDLELQECVMEGRTFSNLVGGLAADYDGDGGVVAYKVGDMAMFAKVATKLRVLARCSPEDKLTLVIGLRALGEVVAVTGDGSNDALALKKSDVGLAMMSGTTLAKDAADIILLDDNFQSVVNTVKWGRNVYAGIRKFLQF